jgi:phage protein D
MTATAFRKSGLPETDYYAPDYKIIVGGEAINPSTKGDVLDLKVVMDIENMTSFDMTINNWDDEKFEFKYSEGAIFDVGAQVEVMMGYADSLKSMVIGQISTLAPKFPESGPPTIQISGLDGLLKLRDRKPKDMDQKIFENMADWEIAEIVGQRNGLKVNVTPIGEKHKIVVQKNQDDATFLMERAKRIDFDCYILTDPESRKDVLHFVEPTDGRKGDKARLYVFEWGKSLINFSPKLTLSRQVASVTVRGWNPDQKAPIKVTASAGDLPAGDGKGKSGPQAAAQHLSNKEEVVIDAPVTSEQEARDLAKSLLRERAYEFITGSGRVIGLADLRPSDNVELQNLGNRFSGTYYVKKVSHGIGSSGYQTDFEVRKLYDGGTQ